ncbi:tetratricopeptide repeat protein [Leptospira wolffii]|uniref:Tetratricopeptide repeat protein n=1 Tax=Leptospira wolffii TaxID=409998 RepID=A0ABV5BJE8_9LEPT|nr:hypothetical protein [Leptospira wolffii]EPG64310.1 tetratricopeptide repeat protein [Leptospira wolffii serovar Khorat str. Khorat-H2]TGL49155.1 hypothetical protein EHQ61_11850 [Leptospira wolffii]
MRAPLTFLALLLFILTDCKNLSKFSSASKIAKPPTVEDLEAWKRRLDMDESEIVELEKKIREMAAKTRSAGALSWKIAQGYMKIGDYDLAAKYYNNAIQAEVSGKKSEVVGADVHFFESALPYFDKALLLAPVDQQLLFETGLAYANASKDRGWEPKRRQTAVEIFQSLTRQDPRDSRFPYQLALIYFDSSMNDSSWEGLHAGFQDQDKAFSLLDSVLKKEPRNVPVLFAKANFLYRSGKTDLAKEEYLRLKTTIEGLKTDGFIKEDLNENESYKNVINNLKKMESSEK